MPRMLVTIAGIPLKPGFMLPDDATDADIRKAAQRIWQTKTHVAIQYRTTEEVAVYLVDNRYILLKQKAANKWDVNWSLDVSLAEWTHCTFEGHTLVKLDVSDTDICLDLMTFKSLRYLDCCDTNLTSLNVSNNPALETLSCAQNFLTKLDLSCNVALEILGCDDNKLTELDLSQNVALEILGCDDNKLTELDLSQNVALQLVACTRNNLAEVDVSRSVALKAIWCGNSKLTRLKLPDTFKSGQSLSGVSVMDD